MSDEAHLPNVISVLRVAGSIGLLFLTVPTMFWSMIPISIVAALATFAAVQEGHFIRTKQVCFESLSHRTIIQVPVEKA